MLEKQKLFTSIRYRKTSHTQDVKSKRSSQRSLRRLAQPKCDSAFEQKTRIAPSRDTSGSSQNIFFSYNQRKKQSRAQTDNFGTYSTSFWKVGVFFSVKSPNFSRKVCRKIIKTTAYKTKRRRPRFQKNQSCFFNYSVLQDISNAGRKSQGTERSFQKIAQPKRDSAFEQESRFISNGEICGSSQNSFFMYNQRIEPTGAQKDLFWNVLNVSLESFCFAEETKAVFISIRCPKTSQTQDVKNKITRLSHRKLAQPTRDSAFEQKTFIFPSREIWRSSQYNFL